MHKRCIFPFISFLSLLGILVPGFESIVFVSLIRILEIAALKKLARKMAEMDFSDG